MASGARAKFVLGVGRKALQHRLAQASVARYVSGQIAGNLLRGELTAFEKKAVALNLTEKQWPESAELFAWAAKHRNHKWVPEELLRDWGMKVKLPKDF